jgi:UDP-glucose 4-epimerase
MNVIVTGGAGFIGSYLVNKLVNTYDVTVVDDLSHGEKKRVNRKADFVQSDLLHDSHDFLEGADAVFHLAANPDVRIGAHDTNIHVEQNILVTHRLLDAMRHHGVENIIFTSSSTVYGERTSPLKESDYCSPISTYGASKLACEALISSFCHTFRMKGWIFRLANIVGPHLNHGVIFDFIEKLKDNPSTLEILGDGKQEKSYLHVSDCIDAMVHGFVHSNNAFNLFNIGSQDSITVDEIAQIVSKTMDVHPRFSYTGGDRGWLGDVPKFRLDITKIKNLGWNPKYGSRDAVEKTAKILAGRL